MKEKKNSIGYELLLILVTIFWGTTFVAQSTAMDRIGPFTFVAVRFAITSVVLMGVSALWLKIRRVRCCRIQKCGNGNLQAKAAIKQNALDIQIDWKRTIKGGLICGVALFTGAVFQQIGLVSTTVGEGAFLSSCYILLVPVAGLIFLKKKPAWTAWLGAAIAVVGVYFISMEPGQGDIHVTPGNLWMLLAACGFTWQILEVDEYSKGTDLMWLASIQFGVVALLSFAGMLLFERCSWEDLLLARGSILYAALVSGAFCYTSQVIAQKHVEPTLASLIMGAESVFATLSGVIFLQENIGIRKYIGCALVLAAIVAAQMKVSGKERA